MENLKKALGKIISTSMIVDKSLEDQHVDILEWVKIGSSVAGWLWIFRNFKLIISEVKNLDDVKSAELHAWIVQVFDLRNDVAERVIEEAIGILIMFAAMMNDSRDIDPLGVAYWGNSTLDSTLGGSGS
jgi:hypothetical protein